jgi:hypothetical protein
MSKRNSIENPGGYLLTFAALFIIGVIIHALVLKFIFPGYYDPLSPNHEDFYIPVAFAHAPGNYYSFGALMNWTRPVFMMFYKAIGYAGSEGAVGFVIALVIANSALTALLIKRVLNISSSNFFILTFCSYCFLLFSMPYFYIFYTEDPGSHLSFFFLLLATCSVIFLANRKLWFSLLLASVFSIMAYLSKETYELVALFLSGLWFLYYRKESLKKALIPAIATVIGIMVSVLNNMRLNSVFVNPDAGEGDPYKMVLTPYSIVREMWRYFKEGMNVANILLVLIIAYLVYSYFRNKGSRSREILFLTVGCLVSPFLAWLPNALLPNHHYGGYSYNGLNLFYLPLILLPFLRLNKALSTGALILLVLLIPASHFLNKKWYNHPIQRTVLIYEDTQRNLHYNLDSLINTLDQGQQPGKVLIKGVTFPFSPFVYPESLREFANASYATYDVVNYTGKFRYEGRRDLVKFINEPDTGFVQYSRVWTFNNDGTLNAEQSSSTGTKRSADSTGVLVTLESLSDFKTSGIYGAEGGLAWTSGNVNIELNTPIKSKDTLNAKLSTFLPEVCKNITPKLVLVDIDGNEHAAIATQKKNDIFYYTFTGVDKAIQRVNIISPTLQPSATDQRILSFPFIELYIR